MSFGNQAVTFVTINESSTDVNALGIGRKSTPNVVVRGCRHRPLKSEETPEYLEVDTGTQIWKTTAPPAAAAAAAASTGRIIVDGQPYDIIGGAMPFTDANGRLFKVTILSTSLDPRV
ncbi:hypothetical protein [Mycobacterium palustre]|uniref:Head-to-tail stopper n=1 Tax=Mycobacterium palustre TaxID=153971 RepID=A0A1X1ZC48_9MYCO|nr:hypothetical protein [Mycobacterium palustre]MCV7100080.1 hypothetical protein [Mycobacterium palustre]ORW20912.1 hypothetical protein AWC19_14185 [Mycobacterium palustre]